MYYFQNTTANQGNLPSVFQLKLTRDRFFATSMESLISSLSVVLLQLQFTAGSNTL